MTSGIFLIPSLDLVHWPWRRRNRKLVFQGWSHHIRGSICPLQETLSRQAAVSDMWLLFLRALGTEVRGDSWFDGHWALWPPSQKAQHPDQDLYILQTRSDCMWHTFHNQWSKTRQQWKVDFECVERHWSNTDYNWHRLYSESMFQQTRRVMSITLYTFCTKVELERPNNYREVCSSE